MKNKSLYLSLVVGVTLAAALLIYNIISLNNNCFHAMDFGIYQQGIYEIASSGQFNPYLTIRDIRIFSDHFDPVLLLAVPVAWIFSYSPVALLVFEWIFFCTYIFLGFLHKYKESSKEALLIVCMILLTKGFLTGFTYPLHPTVWAIIPVFYLIYSFYKDNDRAVVVFSLILCFFKEIFPFAIIFLSFYYLLRKNYKVFLSLLLISGLFFVFIFIIRPLLYGSTVSHATGHIGHHGNVFELLISRIIMFEYKIFFKLFYPFVIPLFLIVKELKEVSKKESWFSHPMIPTLFYLTPLLLIHLLTSKFHYHYGTIFVAPLIALIVFSKVPKVLLQNRKLLIITMALFFVSSMSVYTKIIKIHFNDPKKCVISKGKREDTKKIQAILDKADKAKIILTTGGISPHIIRPGRKVYQLQLFANPQLEYDFLILELNNSGDIYPLEEKDVASVRKRCASESTRVILDNEFYFFAEGKFTKQCLTGVHFEENRKKI